MLWSKDRKRPQAVHQSAGFVDENPKVSAVHMHKNKSFLLVSECTFINASVWLTLPFQLDLSVKVTGADVLILWVWYFSWIAERIMNVKSLNGSFRGPYSKGWIYSYLPRQQLWMTVNKTLFQTLIICHAKEVLPQAKGHPSLVFIRRVLVCLLPGSCGYIFSDMYAERLRGISPLMSTSTLVCEEEIW